MNVNKLIDDYVECNCFKILIEDKITIYYYKNIDHFSDNRLVISCDKKSITLKGSNLIIETLFKEYIIISGNIKEVILSGFYE